MSSSSSPCAKVSTSKKKKSNRTFLFCQSFFVRFFSILSSKTNKSTNCYRFNVNVEKKKKIIFKHLLDFLSKKNTKIHLWILCSYYFSIHVTTIYFCKNVIKKKTRIRWRKKNSFLLLTYFATVFLLCVHSSSSVVMATSPVHFFSYLIFLSFIFFLLEFSF